MTCAHHLLTGLAAALALAAPVRSQTKPEFFVAKLENGVSVGFAFVRSGADRPGGAYGEAVFPRSSGLSRVLYDETAGVYFGYRLEVSRSDKRLKATILPLSADTARELQKHVTCRDCKPPKPLSGALSRIPAPLTLPDGDLLTIELLFNPATGEKILDVVKLSTSPFNAETMRAAAERILDATRTTQRADILAARGAYDRAIDEYRHALELNPNDATVQNKLGICLQQLKQPRRAEDQYRQALRINPHFAEAWNNLGSIAHGNGDYKQAIKHYQKAIALRPAFATAYRNLGAAHFALEQLEDGLAAWESAYRIDPSVLSTSVGSSIAARGMGAGEQYFYFAKICAQTSQVDNALHFLKQAKDAGFRSWKKVDDDRSFEAVVRDPRYKELTGTAPPKQ